MNNIDSYLSTATFDKGVTFTRRPYYNVRGKAAFPADIEPLKLMKLSKSLVKGDKVYFTKMVNFPRVKLREWGKENGVKIVRTPDAATKIVIDKNFINDILNYDMPHKGYNNHKYIACNYNGSTYFTRYWGKDDFKKELKQFEKLKTSGIISAYSEFLFLGNVTLKTIEHMEDIFDLVKKVQKYTFIDVDDVQNSCDNGMIIDWEAYRSISAMFESRDSATIAIAANLLVGPKFEESLFYTSLLLRQYDDTVYRYCPSIFKSVKYKAFVTSLSNRLAGYISRPGYNSRLGVHNDAYILHTENIIFKQYKVQVEEQALYMYIKLKLKQWGLDIDTGRIQVPKSILGFTLQNFKVTPHTFQREGNDLTQKFLKNCHNYEEVFKKINEKISASIDDVQTDLQKEGVPSTSVA